MADVDDFLGEFDEGRRLNRKLGPRCEALNVQNVQCSITGTSLRDGHTVCKRHAHADYPLTYIHKEGSE